MYVEGQHNDGDTVTRNVPVLIGGVDSNGKVQTFAPGTDGGIALSANAPTNAATAAYATSLVVKAAAGTLYGISGYNSKTSAQFIQLHDAAALPANTAVPVVTLTVPASSNFSIDFGLRGKAFATGIVAADSSTGPTLTVGSADCWFEARYT
jgi:hypothetical protein